ncbi:hypothetical protein MKX03_017797 [Papaver bracteatum]|nr:hypothetical protein MKX03_017797 [Papaver bracteatum]
MNGAPRTSNSVMVISSLLTCLLVAGFEIVQGKAHVVGDVQGWDLYPNLINWPKGKQFYAGDVLVFNYNTKGGDLYSPAKVDKSGYDKCDCSSVKMRNRFKGTGHDHLQLTKGYNYFISADKDYCGFGMKIAVYAK